MIARPEELAPLSVEISGVLPEGVVLTALTPHADDRGVFTELFRECWPTAIRPIQWNVVSSKAGVLRGVHVHVRHDDYLTVASGAACARIGRPPLGARLVLVLSSS